MTAIFCQGEAMLEDLNERLITHHVGGTWRAPYSERMRNLRPLPAGPVIGALAEADAQDIARAMRASEAGAASMDALGQSARDRLAAAFLSQTRERGALIAAARALERGQDRTSAEAEVQRMLRAMERALSEPVPESRGTAGPMMLILGTAAGALESMGTVLLQRLRTGGAFLLKPAPRAPVVPAVLMDALASAGLPPGAGGLLQGGGVATGAPLLLHLRVTRAVLAGKATARAELAAAARAGGVQLECSVASSDAKARPAR